MRISFAPCRSGPGSSDVTRTRPKDLPMPQLLATASTLTVIVLLFLAALVALLMERLLQVST
jgi:hypothetical protein